MENICRYLGLYLQTVILSHTCVAPVWACALHPPSSIVASCEIASNVRSSRTAKLFTRGSMSGENSMMDLSTIDSSVLNWSLESESELDLETLSTLDLSDIEKCFLDDPLDFELEDDNCSNCIDNDEEYDKIARICNYICGEDHQMESLLDGESGNPAEAPNNETLSKKLKRKRKIGPVIPKRKRINREKPTAPQCMEATEAQDTPDILPTSKSLSAPVHISSLPVIQVFGKLPPEFTPQHIISLPPGANIIFYTAPSSVSPPFQAQPAPPVSTVTISEIPTVPMSIPCSPDKNCSFSPFTPAAADLPNSPEATAMSQYPLKENETVTPQSLAPMENSFAEKEKNKYVDLFKAALTEKYKNLWAFERDVLYTDIALVKSRIDPKPGKVTCKTAEKELVIYDLDEREKEAVDHFSLFADKERKEMETNIIALLGQSGMGKTVLAKKICQDWSNGAYSQFSLVIFFEWSMLASCKKQYSLKDFLFELSCCPHERNVEIYQYILRNPEKVLLIFDGVDEFQDSEGLMQASYTASPTKTHKIKELFTGLFQKKLLRGCTMLITARPKDKFNQYLTKVDQIVEMSGFSQQQVEWYVNEYFKGFQDFTDVLKWMREYEYLFRYCYIPFMCRIMCLFAETNFRDERVESHFSLAEFMLTVLQRNEEFTGQGSSGLSSDEHSNMKGDQAVQCASTPQPSLMENEMDLSNGVHTKHKLPVKKHHINNGNSLVQHFRTAQSLMEHITDKHFVRYASLELKKKRNHDNCTDMVRRCLVGLLFRKDLNTDLLKVILKKQKKMTDYFKAIQPETLCPQRLLELCHCVCETNDISLSQHTAQKLSNELSFVGTRLTPPDVYVLKCILKHSHTKISLDLRRTGIDQQGLKELVKLKTIKSFRASLSDTVRLWKTLQTENNLRLLKLCVMKFRIDPFTAESIKDITDLTAIVSIQNEICSCLQELTDGISEIPAIKTLKKIIFRLGKSHGQNGFMRLVDILPQLPSLQHLDLHSLIENHIGDKSVAKLAEKFPEMLSLETLDLSQNTITDVGAAKLAMALPSLGSLHTLSLFNNFIQDDGAKKFAEILPEMSSLEKLHLAYNKISDVGARNLTESLRKCPKMKSLMIYSSAIPHNILHHLQQQDPRISCQSFG
uniref:Class II, major histocompatibility complex, transactivator n=2 Tax=Xenopus tropicalis TaxID=8364 RepID=A0A803K664_XENTR